jgi:quercetin dioxygenase-like cupin family protein
MKVVTMKDMQTGPGPEDWFTGVVWRDAAPTGSSPDVAVNRVLFDPGARTHWPTHPETRQREGYRLHNRFILD